MAKLKVLFLGIGNSCCSQMAEGWARHLKSYAIDAHSGGIDPQGMNPDAVEVMRDAGIDISRQKSKHVDELADINFDYVVTVCDDAREKCPALLRKARVVHVGFDDPPALAKSANNREEALEHYRRVRDEIRDYVEMLPTALTIAPAREDPGSAEEAVARAEASADDGAISKPPIEYEKTALPAPDKRFVDGPLTRRDAAMLVIRFLSLYEVFLCLINFLAVALRTGGSMGAIRDLRLVDFFAAFIYGSCAVVLWLISRPLSAWIARVRPQSSEEGSPEPSPSRSRDLLAVGIALMGVWMIVFGVIQAATQDVLSVLSSVRYSVSLTTPDMWTFVAHGVKLVVGLYLILKSRPLATRWDRLSWQPEKAENDPL